MSENNYGMEESDFQIEQITDAPYFRVSFRTGLPKVAIGNILKGLKCLSDSKGGKR